MLTQLGFLSTGAEPTKNKFPEAGVITLDWVTAGTRPKIFTALEPGVFTDSLTITTGAEPTTYSPSCGGNNLFTN
jgi:hypothetical protein